MCGWLLFISALGLDLIFTICTPYEPTSHNSRESRSCPSRRICTQEQYCSQLRLGDKQTKTGAINNNKNCTRSTLTTNKRIPKEIVSTNTLFQAMIFESNMSSEQQETSNHETAVVVLLPNDDRSSSSSSENHGIPTCPQHLQQVRFHIPDGVR